MLVALPRRRWEIMGRQPRWLPGVVVAYARTAIIAENYGSEYDAEN